MFTEHIFVIVVLKERLKSYILTTYFIGESLVLH